MGEAADCKLQLKVELLQSLKKERSETFLQFSQRVEAAASILKTTVESVCFETGISDFVKLLFLAGLNQRESAACYGAEQLYLQHLVELLTSKFPNSNNDQGIGSKEKCDMIEDSGDPSDVTERVNNTEYLEFPNQAHSTNNTLNTVGDKVNRNKRLCIVPGCKGKSDNKAVTWHRGLCLYFWTNSFIAARVFTKLTPF